MKTVLFALAALAVAFVTPVASVTPAQAQEAKQDFTLVNKTGYELKSLFVSPSKSDDWEEDVLGQDTLGDGEHVHITFHRDTKTCHWDLKVVYSVDGTHAIWSDINLCEVDKITIRYDKDRDVTTATFD